MAPNVTLKSIGLYKKKISTGSLAEIDKLILKFKWKYKRHRRGKAMLRKGDKEDSHFLISQLTTKLQHSTVWYRQKDRHKDQ